LHIRKSDGTIRQRQSASNLGGGGPVRSGRSTASSPQRRQVAPEIPASEFARIRIWVKYGMTVSQVAQVYGVAVDQVERVLRKA
jgi:hypothetical protein